MCPHQSKVIYYLGMNQETLTAVWTHNFSFHQEIVFLFCFEEINGRKITDNDIIK